MALQRYFLYTTKQIITKGTLQNNLKQSYCELRHKYSSDSGRKYTERHEWIVLNNKIGTVGITKYAQDALGDVVFAQLPDPGSSYKAGDECGALESVKAASEIYCPVTGTVTEKNPQVEEKPGLINSSCYDDGWLFKIEIKKEEELKELMNEEQYETFLKTDSDKDHA